MGIISYVQIDAGGELVSKLAFACTTQCYRPRCFLILKPAFYALDRWYAVAEVESQPMTTLFILRSPIRAALNADFADH